MARYINVGFFRITRFFLNDMEQQISFETVETDIPCSQKRIVALWYADVEQLDIEDTELFSGIAILFTSYDISGALHYYVSLFNRAGVLCHTWQCEPDNIRLTSANQIEKEIFTSFKAQNVVFQPVLRSSYRYQGILKKLPLQMAIDDKTPCVGDFQTQLFVSSSAKKGIKLSAADRTVLKNIVALF